MNEIATPPAPVILPSSRPRVSMAPRRFRPKPMQLHQIKYFVVLCEERNFTRAARRCNIAQPSLTKAIRALERELGGLLFRRKPKIELSELGHAVRPHLEQIAGAMEKARQTAIALGDLCGPEPNPCSGPVECLNGKGG